MISPVWNNTFLSCLSGVFNNMYLYHTDQWFWFGFASTLRSMAGWEAHQESVDRCDHETTRPKLYDVLSDVISSSGSPAASQFNGVNWTRQMKWIYLRDRINAILFCNVDIFVEGETHDDVYLHYNAKHRHRYRHPYIYVMMTSEYCCHIWFDTIKTCRVWRREHYYYDAFCMTTSIIMILYSDVTHIISRDV